MWGVKCCGRAESEMEISTTDFVSRNKASARQIDVNNDAFSHA